MDIGHDQPRACRMQLAAQVPAHRAKSLHGNGYALQAVTVQHVAHGGFDADEHAIGGLGRRVAAKGALARHAADVAGLRAGGDHVFHRGADVFGGDVAAVQRFDHAAEGTEQLGAVGLRRGAQDHGLAAAEGQVGQRILVGHALRQAQGVGQGIALGRVGPVAAAAKRGAKAGAVDGDDGLQAGLGIGGERDTLVGRAFASAEQAAGGLCIDAFSQSVFSRKIGNAKR